jgi:pimeloyl-ACP methyl ester carboxylesterase
MRAPRSLAALALAPALAGAQPAASPARHLEGRLASGAPYAITVPANWNGSLLLFSHGYARTVSAAPKLVARDEADDLLARGFALAASSYAAPGWAVEEAVPDQLATLDVFVGAIGTPRRTYAWGSSMGALVTSALMERAPGRFDGALMLCASAGGTLGMMNAALDGAWVLRTLAAPGSALSPLLESSGAQMTADLAGWQALLDAQQATALGRARIALAATLAQVPAYIDANGARARDPAAQQQALYQGFIAATMLPRDDQLRRAGGNFSWNTGVDYTGLLARSGRAGFVKMLYRAAGRDLDADLAQLAQAPRVAADPSARDYMARNFVPHGRVKAPVLLMQSVADPVTLVEMTADYGQRIRRESGVDMAREVYIGRAGHCNFETAETVAALLALDLRRSTGAWSVDIPGAVPFTPAPFLRAEP